MKPTRVLPILTVLLTAGMICHSRVAVSAPLAALQADTCFNGMTARGPMPVVVTATNAGPSVDGALVVRSSTYSGTERDYLYPISLPTGAQKRVFVYPNVGQDTAKITVGFDGPAKIRDVILPVTFASDGTQQVGMIGDRIGALSALRGKGQPGLPGGYSDSYAQPEDAPERASGYRSLSTLILSDGAERMDGEQWNAIRQWVIDGGSLILLGGASGAYLRLPDAQPLIPLAQLHGVDSNGVDTPAGVPPGSVALTTGVPKPGATVVARQDGSVTLASERYGAGRILFVAYDPMAAPFRGWASQTRLWTALLGTAHAPLEPHDLSNWAMAQSRADDTTTETHTSTVGGVTTTTTIMHTSGGGTTTVIIKRKPDGSVTSTSSTSFGYAGRPTDFDAFHVQLPPVGSIAWMLLAYFVAVVPVTYFVLKKLRRLEWAWVTSPLISLAFAYGFYLFTADLYKAGLSRRTAGVITAVAGDTMARFSGDTELFFPRGGDYALVIPDAETLETTDVTDNSEGGGATDLQPLQTIDTGAVSAPHYGATNLNFKRIYYTQPLAWGTGIGAEAHRDARGEVSGRITNRTAFPLHSAVVVFPGTRRYASLPDLPPGKSAAFTMMPAAAYTTGDLIDWQQIVRTLPADPPENTALLLARTEGDTIGPNLGRDVGHAGSVRVVVSLPIQ